MDRLKIQVEWLLCLVLVVVVVVFVVVVAVVVVVDFISTRISANISEK